MAEQELKNLEVIEKSLAREHTLARKLSPRQAWVKGCCPDASLLPEYHPFMSNPELRQLVDIGDNSARCLQCNQTLCLDCGMNFIGENEQGEKFYTTKDYGECYCSFHGGFGPMPPEARSALRRITGMSDIFN